MKYSVTQCKNIVTKIMTEFPDTRDCDQKLTARIWLYECKLNSLDPSKTLEHLFYSRLSTPTTIIRTRRLIQNDNESLRGSKYNLRTTRLERDVRDELRKRNGNRF